MYLYLDTTEKISIGLLDEKFNWISYLESEEKVVSKVVHTLINNILEERSLSFDDLKGAFFSSGPGSYTGMRVSDGIAKVFKWHNIAIYSFYHFDVPRLLDVPSGAWIAKAFKGESFVFEWNQSSTSKKLIKEIDGDIDNQVFNHDKTKKLIKENSEVFFNQIISFNKYLDLYYYRELEVEFQRS